jgi:hypothetical protein
MIKFKKISAVIASVLMAGATVGFATAANYPAPFVDGGVADVAIVYGTGAGGISEFDKASAANIQYSLGEAMPSTGSSVTIDGESISLASGSDLLYLNDDLSENIQTITKSNLPNTLADGIFTDDGGTDYDYEQTITIGTSTTNNVAFSDSDNDFDDPTVMMDLSTSTSNPIYTWSVTFDNAINFTSSDSEGEEITLFGKTYTVGTATDDNTLILLGGSDSTTINVGETSTLTVNGESYVVELTGISSATTAQAGIIVNGETKTFTQGQTKSVAGIDVYMKTVFRTGDNTGYIEVQLGADKLTFETGNAVQMGSDNDDIDGTLVTMTPATATGMQALTAMTVAVVGEDNDANHILMGESFVDPVFGSLSLVFSGMENGPTIVDHKDTSLERNLLEISKGGDRELLLTFTDGINPTNTVPFTYNGALSDDSSNTIHIVEGANLTDDSYFILNSGNYQHLMQMTKVDADSSGQVTFKDLMTGTSYGTESGTNHTADQTEYISNQAYTISRNNDLAVTIVSSDYGTGIADGNDVDVFPMIELVSGEDTRFAFTDNVTALTDFVSGGVADAKTVTLNLPTGTLAISNSATNTSIRVAGVEHALSTDTSYLVGDVYYNVATGAGDVTTNYTTVTVAIEAVPATGAGTLPVTTPGILFVEDEDKSETTTTTKPAIHLVTNDTGSYSTCLTPLFTGTSDTATFDNSDYVGYLTNFGTYVLKDSSDDNQAFTSLTYPENPMYFDVSFAEADATIVSGGASALGEVIVKDTELDSVKTQNLIIVGGSCINSAAATILGGACGPSFTEATGIGTGQFLIKGVQDAFTTGKLALVVAGYELADTAAATTYLTNKDVDTLKTYEGVTLTNIATEVTTTA